MYALNVMMLAGKHQLWEDVDRASNLDTLDPSVSVCTVPLFITIVVVLPVLFATWKS